MLVKFVKKHWPLLILLGFFGWLFFNLLSSHMLLAKNDGLYSGGSTWGDLAFHLSLITAISERGGSALEEHPVFPGEKLRYPFISDLISALLVKMGISLRWSLILPSFAFLMVLIALFYFLVWKITKSKIGALLVPFLFFFNGSAFGLGYFFEDFKKSSLGFLTFLGRMTKQYAHLADYHINFSNIIADYILPQRAVILGLLLGVAVVYFLWDYWQNRNPKKLLFAGLISGLLPLVHTHTFMALAVVAGLLLIIDFFQHLKNFQKIIVSWLWFFVPMIFLALPQVLWLLPSSGEGFFKFGFGWMKDGQNFFWFWFRNLGLYLVAFIAAFIFSRPKLKTFYLPFLGLFIISNIVIFQPHIYDNMKVMLWWFLLSVILIGDWFGALRKKLGKRSYPVIIAIFLLLIPTGFLSVFRETYVSWQFFSNEDLALAEFVKNNTPKEAIFLTSDRHNHPVPCLTGRRILMGYRGWLWTHGINYRQREMDVIAMYEGGEKSLNLLENYDVDYAMIEKEKIADFHMNPSFFEKNFPLIYQSPNFSVFKIVI